jgi:acetyl esterase/lipase
MNKMYILLALALLTAGVQANAAKPQPKTKLRPTKTLLLYPEGQNVDKGIVENGTTITLGPGESNGISGVFETQNDWGDLRNIADSARIEIYMPKKPNGQMIVCCPGGGYSCVSAFNEGAYVADYFTKKGIAVCVVSYRLPNGHWQVPLTDVQNAFRYCRAHADEWGMKQIGIIGFSAGGHLAGSASTLFVDEVTRPDFSILVYPVVTMDMALTHKGTHNQLIGTEDKWLDESLPYKEYLKNKAKYEELTEHYSLEKQVSENTPPTIFLLSSDDGTVNPENSIRYFRALLDKGVSAQMYVYPYGGHGWGFTTKEFGGDHLGDYRKVFFNALDTWLAEIKK